MKYLDTTYSNAFFNMERILKSIPSFGLENDMRRPSSPPLPRFTSNKPSKKRGKVKAGRKSNLKNRKR